MSTTSQYSRDYTPEETAFIIGYADYCIYNTEDYAATVATELRKFSQRSATWATVRSRLARVLRRYGVSKPSLPEFTKLGTAYLDITIIPDNVRTQLDRLCNGWGFSPLGAEATVPEPSVPVVVDDPSSSDETESCGTEDPVAMESGIYHCTTTRRIEETPDLDGHDGAADRLSTPINPLTPPPVAPSKQAAGRKRSVTPTDLNDSDYAPSPKRNKSSGGSSSQAHAARRGVAVVKTKGAAKAHHSEEPDRQVLDKNDTTVSCDSSLSKSAPVEDRNVSVIDLNEISGESETAASPGRVAEASKDNAVAANQHVVESSRRAGSKRKVVDGSEDETTSVENVSRRQKTSEDTPESLVEKVKSYDLKLNAILEMLRSMVSHQQSPSEEFSEHLYQVIRTLKDPKGSVIENLIKGLNSQRALKAKHRDMVQKLVEFVNLNEGTVFPKTPPQNEVDQTWTTFYEHIVSTVGPNNTIPRLKAESAGYLACAAEGIACGRIPDDQLDACIKSLRRYLRSPHAQQTLFSALFCRWVFATPEPMLSAMHSDAMMHLYSAVLDTENSNAEGLAKVQRYDKTATKLMFEDPNFKIVHVARRTSEFEARFEAAKSRLCQPSNIPSSLTPSKFAKEAMEFKQRLLLNPKDYRIHFVRPGYNFDARRMQAYNQNNDSVPDAEAMGKKVRLCVFPMLTCQESQPMKEDVLIQEVLCKNKRFFPTFEEMTTVSRTQVSKAVVMVQVDEEQQR